MSEIPTPFKILSAITAGTLVGCSVAEAISPIPTEQAKNIAGTLELASAEIGDNFWNTQVIYGKLNPLDKEGLTKQDLTCLNIEINKANFDFCTFESRDGAKENWWIKSPEGWLELQKIVKSGYNMDGEIIDVATWVLGNENVIWYPQNQDDWLKDSQNPNFGITFLPPSVFGENPIQGYDRSSGLGIKIPLNQVENDPLSQENIFQAIAYRTGFQIGGITPTLVQPTETPTPSPESLLPQEVKEKFELAGVDLANMQNAQYDKDGLHITLPGGEVIVLTNDQLQKGMYNGQDNVLQYRDEANQNAVYAFDKETGKWGVVTLEADLLIKDRIQFAKLDYLLSEQYLKDLIKQDLNGKLPKFTEESFSIRPGTIIRHYKNKENNLTYLNNGFDTIFSISDAKKFIPKNRKAWIIADIKETSINNTQIFLIVYKWKNYDNSIGYTANIAMPDKNMSNQEQLRFESGYNNSLVIPSGAFFENTKSCIKWLSYYKGNANDVCSLFFKNDQMTLPEYIYDNWAETGILKNEVLDNLGNKKLVLPISPSWLQSTSN